MDHIAGKWKTVKTDGEFEKFLQERGVPLPIRKILAFMTSSGKFEYSIVDNAFVEMEYGMITNHTYKGVPLDGTKVDDKAPSQEQVTKTASVKDGKLTILSDIHGEEGGGVDCEIWKDGDFVYRKFWNRKTGTSFTSQMAAF